MGLRFSVLSGCLCAFEMDTQTPQGTDSDGSPRRAVAIILLVMGVFIVVPLALYALSLRGAHPGP